MSVRCGNCGRELDEAQETLPQDRTPCPECGSLTRRFEVLLSASMDVVVTPPTVSAKAVFPPTVVQVGPAEEQDEALPIVPMTGVSPEALATLTEALRDRHPDHVRVFCITDLTDGTFIAEILDENGDVLAQGVGDNEEDAILELADHLKRPERKEE